MIKGRNKIIEINLLEENDFRCPFPGSNELRFLPSEYCDSYYICVNGNPVLTPCRNGLHWNAWEEVCDEPGNAGCDVNSEFNI